MSNKQTIALLLLNCAILSHLHAAEHDAGGAALPQSAVQQSASLQDLITEVPPAYHPEAELPSLEGILPTADQPPANPPSIFAGQEDFTLDTLYGEGDAPPLSQEENQSTYDYEDLLFPRHADTLTPTWQDWNTSVTDAQGQGPQVPAPTEEEQR